MNARAILAGLMGVATLVLGGCYESERLLLDPAQAAAPLAVGAQTMIGDGGRPATAEVALEADGWYRVRVDREAPQRVLFTPLGDGGDRYAFAFGNRGAFVYGVAERREGRVYLDLPFCDLGPARDAAIAHGLEVPAKGAMSPVCSFGKASDLQGALTEYANRPGDKGSLPSLPAR
jgi:hypothetical protein